MEKRYKFIRFKTSSWKKLKREFYGRNNESFSDYIERIAKELNICKLKFRELTGEL